MKPDLSWTWRVPGAVLGWDLARAESIPKFHNSIIPVGVAVLGCPGEGPVPPAHSARAEKGGPAAWARTGTLWAWLLEKGDRGAGGAGEELEPGWNWNLWGLLGSRRMLEPEVIVEPRMILELGMLLEPRMVMLDLGMCWSPGQCWSLG